MENPTQAILYSRRLGGEATYWAIHGAYLLTWLAGVLPVQPAIFETHSTNTPPKGSP